VNSAQHLLTWFTPERRQIINALGLDRAAKRPDGTFSRFLARQRYMTLERVGVAEYYPALRLLGYRPDLDLSQDESVQRHEKELLELERKQQQAGSGE
jgi:hypothetical protein